MLPVVTRDPAAMRRLKAFLIWLVILAAAFVNGGAREAWLVPALGKTPALLLSGVLLSLCILGVAMLFIPRLGPLDVRQALDVGLFWLLLTLAFEWSFGLLVQGRSWRQLGDAYTFRDGNIWPLVLVVTLLAPLVAGRLRRRG